MKSVAILALKGGPGKTTTAIDMSTILAIEHGQRVLLVDCDSQHDVTETLLPLGEYNTITNLLLGETDYVEDVIYLSAVRGLDILPSDFRLALVGMPNVNGGHYSQRALLDVRDAVTEDRTYDYMIMDCPSSFIHPGCQAALLAADEIIIPVEADAYSISSALELVTQVDCLRYVNPELRVAGCLITKYHCNDYVDGKLETFVRDAPVPVFQTRIRKSPKANGGTEAAEGILAYSPRSAIAQDYRQFVVEYLGGDSNGCAH